LASLANFLQYGFAGLAAILAILCFGLLVRELKRDSLRPLAFVFIGTFMIFSLLLAFMAQAPATFYEKIPELVRPDPQQTCRSYIQETASLKREVDRLGSVKIDGTLVGPPDPASVNIMAIRQWKIYSPDSGGKLRQKISQESAALRLLFWAGDYGEIKVVDEDKLVDGHYDLGQIKLREGFNPLGILSSITTDGLAVASAQGRP
jgi:hypothetical protein